MFDWDHSIVTLTEVDADGFVGIQTEPFSGKHGAAPFGEMGYPFGLIGRPHDPELDSDGDPDPAKACGALYAFYGSRQHVWPQKDPRMVARLPKQKKGGTIVYGGKLARPGFVEFDGDTGSLTAYVPYDFDGTGADATPRKACAIAVNVRTAGAETIELTHGAGMQFSMTAGGKNSGLWKNKSGSVYHEINDDLHVLNGECALGAPTGAQAVAIGPAVVDALGAVLDAVTAAGAGANSATTKVAVENAKSKLSAISAKLVKAA
jgi:hypothetical protein